jgi:hypothetical protein
MSQIPTLPSLVARYANRAAYPALSYATVRDFCDSVDHLPSLATHQNDLKDAQRPWAVKAILNCLSPGSKLVEIGSGEPIAAAALVLLGYDVTICDPFDGSGNGPIEYETYRTAYPGVKFVRSLFTPELARTLPGPFDGVFSISVLEHVLGEHLTSAFEAAAIALRPGGYSIHAVDHVLQGNDEAWHAGQVLRILQHQNRLAGSPTPEAVLARELVDLFARAKDDLDTFLLSPQGHNNWRGKTPYDQFPFRKCIAVQTIVRRAAAGGLKLAS